MSKARLLMAQRPERNWYSPFNAEASARESVWRVNFLFSFWWC